MDNIIRPKFGGRSGDDSHGSNPLVLSVPQVLGERAGYQICLCREAVAEREVFRIVAAEVGCCGIEDVAVLAALPDGEAEAIRTGMAILRMLEMLEGKLDSSLA